MKYLPILLCLFLGIVFWMVAGVTYGGIFLVVGLIWAGITLSSAELKAFQSDAGGNREKTD